MALKEAVTIPCRKATKGSEVMYPSGPTVVKSEGELKGSEMVVRGGEGGVNVLYCLKIW